MEPAALVTRYLPEHVNILLMGGHQAISLPHYDLVVSVKYLVYMRNKAPIAKTHVQLIIKMPCLLHMPQNHRTSCDSSCTESSPLPLNPSKKR